MSCFDMLHLNYDNMILFSALIASGDQTLWFTDEGVMYKLGKDGPVQIKNIKYVQAAQYDWLGKKIYWADSNDRQVGCLSYLG